MRFSTAWEGRWVDARDRLRQYLEQRRELGESEYVLDSLSVEDALKSLGMRGELPPGRHAPPSAARHQAERLAQSGDWREALREFISAHTRGTSEYTWRRLNRRHLANDIYMPTPINESVGEVIVAIDTSGSISGPILTAFAIRFLKMSPLI